MTITAQTIHFFLTREAAETVAAAKAPEDDWTYTVIENNAGRFLIEIRDEDGEFVSTV